MSRIKVKHINLEITAECIDILRLRQCNIAVILAGIFINTFLNAHALRGTDCTFVRSDSKMPVFIITTV